MKELVAHKPQPSAFVERLWDFFGCRLICSSPQEAKRSRVNYGFPKEYAAEHSAKNLAPMVFLAKSDRMEEALIHELLHLELVRRGFPRFFFDGTGRGDLAFGISNNADHFVMLPLFAALGYATERFTSESELNEEERRIVAEIGALQNIHTPTGYTEAVSGYLKRHGIGHRLVYVRT